MADNRNAGLAHPYWRGAAAFAIAVGAVMVAVWAWLLLTGGYPELTATPLSGWVHLLVELGTAALLIVSGFGLIGQKTWSRKTYLLAVGALLIAVINAIAFYGERGDTTLVILFILLAILAVFFAIRAEE